MKQSLRRRLSGLLPARISRRLHRMVAALRFPDEFEPWNTTAFASGALPSELVSDVFDRLRLVPGWFNIDDCAHFSLILRYQSAMGISADLFEIGSYHGRSTALLAWARCQGERIVVCDAFEQNTADSYSNPPTPEQLMANLRAVCSDLDDTSVEIHACLSSELTLDPDVRFRFAHIDGGHSKEVALGDLLLCAPHIVEHGVIAVDDYMHAKWPQVTDAVAEFLERNDDFRVLADLNRHGAIGRKLYLIRAVW